MVLPVIMVVLGALLIYASVKGKHPIKIVRETLTADKRAANLKDDRPESPGGGTSLKGGRI